MILLPAHCPCVLALKLQARYSLELLDNNYIYVHSVPNRIFLLNVFTVAASAQICDVLIDVPAKDLANSVNTTLPPYSPTHTSPVSSQWTPKKP